MIFFPDSFKLAVQDLPAYFSTGRYKFLVFSDQFLVLSF